MGRKVVPGGGAGVAGLAGEQASTVYVLTGAVSLALAAARQAWVFFGTYEDEPAKKKFDD
jgi:hypothetical protein